MDSFWHSGAVACSVASQQENKKQGFNFQIGHETFLCKICGL